MFHFSRAAMRSLMPALACAAMTAHAQSPLPEVGSYAVSQRQSIAVTPVEHAHLMTEMNDFMIAVHSIHTALAAKDMATVVRLGNAMGPKGGKHDAVGKAVHDKLPKEWFALARPTHHAFVAVAQEAANPAATVESVLGKLAGTTQQCVSCHAAFKLTVAP
jgi:hypothetical protein